MNNRLTHITLIPEQIIVHAVDFNNFSVDECFDMHKQLQKEFLNNKVITIPCSSYIKVMDKKSSIEYLKQIIKELKGEIEDE